MRNAVNDWQELSALYEKADTLAGAELAAWLDALRRQPHPLVGPLLQMLDARAEVRDNGFLDTLPRPVLEPVPVAIEWREGARVGPYRLERPLGAGGMAEVWMAQRDDGAFRRTVAVKLLFRHASSHERDSFAQRFARERDILASLHHPNIAGLHDAGVTAAGQPWLALEYIEGEPLTAWCDNARLGVRARVELFRQVLLAVQHAHANLVIHRDLKPANILVTTTGEVRLLDFGIAKLMEAEGGALADTELTRHAGRLMTVRYASPEQLTGQPLTTACDVYSLGVVLYELLCGEPPYEVKVESAAQIEQAILEVDPRPPSRRTLSVASASARGSTRDGLRKALTSDLDAIVLRALAKKPAQRYGSVEALRVELDRWLAGEPVEARTPSGAYRLRKFVGRHTVGVALGASAVAALLAVTLIAVWLGLQARQESDRATAARDFMMGMFRQADSDKSHGSDVTARELLDRGRDDVLRRLKDQPKLQADLLQGIAGIQSSMDEMTKADVTFDELAKLYRRMGDPHRAALALAGRANNALRMGNLPLAHRLVAEASDTDRSAGPAWSPVRDRDAELPVSLGLTNGWLALWEGDAAKARGLFQENLASAEKAFGKNAAQSLAALVGLVQSDASLRDFEAALAMQDELAARQLQVAARTPRDVVDLDVSAAELLYMAGRFDDVAARRRAALPRCVSALGRDDASCRRLVSVGVAAEIRLGAVAAVRGDLPVLQAMADDASSPDFQASALLTLFRARSQLGELGAFPELRSRVAAMAGDDRATAVAPIQRVMAQQTLAEDALRAGRLAEASQWLARAMSLRDATGDKAPGYAPTAATRMLQGGVALADGHPDIALGLMSAALDEAAQVVGATHPQTMIMSLNIASAMAALNRPAEGLAVVARAEPVLRVALGVDSPTYRRMQALASRLAQPRAPATPTSAAGRKQVSSALPPSTPGAEFFN